MCKNESDSENDSDSDNTFKNQLKTVAIQSQLIRERKRF